MEWAKVKLQETKVSTTHAMVVTYTCLERKGWRIGPKKPLKTSARILDNTANCA